MEIRTRRAESAGSSLRALDNTRIINPSVQKDYAPGKDSGCRIQPRFIDPLIVRRYRRRNDEKAKPPTVTCSSAHELGKQSFRRSSRRRLFRPRTVPRTHGFVWRLLGHQHRLFLVQLLQGGQTMNETLAFALAMAGILIVIALLLAQSTPDTAEREHDDSPQL